MSSLHAFAYLHANLHVFRPFSSFATQRGDAFIHMQASTAATSALEAIQNVATTVGSSLSYWGNFITDLVAEVVGDSNEPTEEEVQAVEQKRYSHQCGFLCTAPSRSMRLSCLTHSAVRFHGLHSKCCLAIARSTTVLRITSIHSA